VHVATCALPDGVFTGTLGDAIDALEADAGLARSRAAESLASAIRTRLSRASACTSSQTAKALW
jgi:hypothetical protein